MRGERKFLFLNIGALELRKKVVREEVGGISPVGGLESVERQVEVDVVTSRRDEGIDVVVGY